MQVCAVTGSGAAGAAGMLVEALADRGSVAVANTAFDPPDAARQFREAGAAAVVATDGDRWAGTGEGRSVGRHLDWFAPDYEYALVVGRPVRRHPVVRVGEPEPSPGDGEPDPGSEIRTVDRARDLDVPAVLEAVESAEPYETLGSLVASVKRAADAERAGAIATFTGRVRARDAPDDDPTEALTFERYEGVAQARLDDLAASLCEREGVYDVALHHRTGRIEYGEDIVFVVVLAGHRDEAFETCRAGIDRLKAEVPIFKKEETTEESFWVHERS